MKTIITELVPTNGRKSFCRKAMVIETNGRRYLRSYDTIAASVDENGNVARHTDWKTKTTSVHVKCFIETFGNHKNDSKSFWTLPVVSAGDIKITI